MDIVCGCRACGSECEGFGCLMCGYEADIWRVTSVSSLWTELCIGYVVVGAVFGFTFLLQRGIDVEET